MLDDDDRRRRARSWPSGSRRSPRRFPAARGRRRARRAAAAAARRAAPSRVRGSAARHARARPPCARRRRGTDSAIAALQHRARPAAQARPQQVELAGAAAPQRDGEVVGDRQRRQTRDGICSLRPMPRRRSDAAQPGAYRAPPKSTLPGLRRQLAASAVERRGLAGAVRADHAEDARLLESERQPVEDRDLADVDARHRRARVSPAAARPDRGGAAIAACSAARRKAALERRPRPDEPCGNSSTTAMKNESRSAISQNWKRSRKCAGERADQQRAERPARAGSRGRRPRPRSRGRPRARSRTAAA